MADIRKLNTADADFQQQLDALLAWESVSDGGVNQVVQEVIAEIRARGDAALVDYTNRFDGWQAASAADLEIPLARLEQAWETIPADQREALQHAAGRVRAYAERQKMEGWTYTEADGTVLGQKVTPLDRVGLYVPGGKAAYPSSVLMNALPAKVAGVAELIMVVPTPRGELNELVLAAAHVCEVDRVFAVGGAQAVAALAYGTESVPPVDKIVGPGNIYVATAKRTVFGQVGIDMVAGPVRDPGDLRRRHRSGLGRHGPVLAGRARRGCAVDPVVPECRFRRSRSSSSIDRLLPGMQRREIIETALRARGALIVCRDLDEAADVGNFIAPEHLELSVADPVAYAEKIQHAGAIFMGRHTSEPLGDYCAGPNHVLPTSRTARFSSPLGVYDFQKRSSLIMVSPAGAQTLGRTASILARGEGLRRTHARQSTG